jgi:hypothetical protein
MVVMVACFHPFGQPHARPLTEPRHVLRAALCRFLEAGGGRWDHRRCGPARFPSCKNVIRLSRQQACSLVPVHGQVGDILYKQGLEPVPLPG